MPGSNRQSRAVRGHFHYGGDPRLQLSALCFMQECETVFTGRCGRRNLDRLSGLSRQYLPSSACSPIFQSVEFGALARTVFTYFRVCTLRGCPGIEPGGAVAFHHNQWIVGIEPIYPYPTTPTSKDLQLPFDFTLDVSLAAKIEDPSMWRPSLRAVTTMLQMSFSAWMVGSRAHSDGFFCERARRMTPLLFNVKLHPHSGPLDPVS